MIKSKTISHLINYVFIHYINKDKIYYTIATIIFMVYVGLIEDTGIHKINFLNNEQQTSIMPRYDNSVKKYEIFVTEKRYYVDKYVFYTKIRA